MFGRVSFRAVREDIENKIKNGFTGCQEIGPKLDSLKTNRLYIGRLNADGSNFCVNGIRHSYKKSVVSELPEEICDLELLEKAGYELLSPSFLENLYSENELDGNVFVDYHISRNCNYEAICTHTQVSTPHEDMMVCSDFLFYNRMVGDISIRPSYVYSPRLGQRKFFQMKSEYESDELVKIENFSKTLNRFFFARSIKS